MADIARDELVATFKGLLASGKYSDLVITYGGDTHKVHKAVVCTRSGFFERAERFAVAQGHDEGKIDLPEDVPLVVALLVQYLYEGEYEPRLSVVKSPDEVVREFKVKDRREGFNYDFPHTCRDDCPNPQHLVCQHHECRESTCEEKCIDFVCEECCPKAVPACAAVEGDATQLLIHSQMYQLGDKYDVIGLKELARKKFKRACTKYWDDECLAPAAHHAFSTTVDEDSGLKEVISQVISDHINLLNKPEVITLLHEFSGLAVGLLHKRAEDLGWDISKDVESKN